jgi:hypothetical protein
MQYYKLKMRTIQFYVKKLVVWLRGYFFPIYDVARLNFYENISDYFLKDIIVNTANNNVDAQCYFPKTDLKVGEFEWNLKLWKNSYGSEILTYATEVMELISTLSYQDAKIFTSEIEKRTLG